MQKSLFVSVFTASTLVASAAVAGEMASKATEARLYQRPVETHPSQGDVRTIESSMATLLTTKEGVFAHLSTQELEPGNAYTLWVVVINEPEACANTPCQSADVLKKTAETKADVGYGGGTIAGPDGTGKFTGFVPVGKLSNAWFDNGLQKPTTAEVHLVIHDHGPLIADRAHAMITTYRDACTDESLPAPVPMETAKADGEPGPNTCKLVQDAIFMQDGTA